MNNKFRKDGPKRFRFTRRDTPEGGYTQIRGKDDGYTYSPRRCLRLDCGLHPTVDEGLAELQAELQEAFELNEAMMAEMSATLHDDYESMFYDLDNRLDDWDLINDARPLATPARLSR